MGTVAPHETTRYESMIGKSWTLVTAVFVILWMQSTCVPAQSTSQRIISCSPEKPTVLPREKIKVNVWIPEATNSSQYAWSANGGHISGGGPEALWDFDGVQPGSYQAIVKIGATPGGSSSCSVQVFVLERQGERGLERVTARSLLVGNAPEEKGYGLYSYLLFAVPPDDSSKERYTKIIEAYLSLIPDAVKLEQYLKPEEMNNTYLPVDTDPPKFISADWVLQHYNYARAVVLLRAIPGTHRDGPYIVSTLEPLTSKSSAPDKYLFQNVSTVPPHLVGAWIKEFINQAAQERFWEPRSVEKLVLNLRTSIGVMAIGLPQVQKALNDLIAWRNSVSKS
jgi:hypothetical protein